MLSTMQDGPLLISGILRHGQCVYGDSEVITVRPGGDQKSTFTQVGERAEKLAADSPEARRVVDAMRAIGITTYG